MITLAEKVPVHVLAVDDRPDGLIVLKAVLDATDIQLVTASSGKEALERVQERDFALILLDVQMPGLNGYETAQRIKQGKRNQETPIIFLTAIHTDFGHVHQGYQSGAVDFLFKPYDPYILRSKVKVFVDLYRQKLIVNELREREHQQQLTETRHRLEAQSLRREMQRQKQLNETLQLFRLVIDSVRDYAIFTLDEDGHITSWNSGAQRLLGYSEAEIMGRDAALFYDDPGEAEWRRELELARATGRVETEGWRRRKDGTRFWGNGIIVDLVDPEGHRRGFVRVMRDFTERKLGEDRLRRSNEELEQFAFVASHDLKEPLRTVTTYLELLRERYSEKLDTDAREFIGYAVDGADRMYDLIDDLLRFSRIGTESVAFSEVDTESLVGAAVANLSTAIQEAGAKVTWDRLPKVVADRSQFTQLFQNLISNAVKFRRDEPPRVHISLVPHERCWHFAVKDNGIGIEPLYLDQIFVIFQRLHQPEEYSGTGIGLALCRKVLDRHRGTIWAESVPGEGSTFHFQFPRELPVTRSDAENDGAQWDAVG